jgi:hypothetical protein
MGKAGYPVRVRGTPWCGRHRLAGSVVTGKVSVLPVVACQVLRVVTLGSYQQDIHRILTGYTQSRYLGNVVSH